MKRNNEQKINSANQRRIDLRINGSQIIGRETKNGPDNGLWSQYAALRFMGSNSQATDLNAHVATFFRIAQ
jgi:hypothetical protein